MVLVMPMNGEGRRFKDAGYVGHKPLLPIRGIPMYQRALQSYPPTAHLLIVSRANILKRYTFPAGISVIRLDEPTAGPLQTLLHPTVAPSLMVDEELLIADCDALIDAQELSWCLTRFRQTGASGGVTIRKTNDPEVSYATFAPKRAGKPWRVLRTAERERLSEWSTTGPYWWKRGSDFVRCGRKSLKNGVVSISPVYNSLIAEGGRVIAERVDSFVHLGTPKAYEDYVKRHHTPL